MLKLSPASCYFLFPTFGFAQRNVFSGAQNPPKCEAQCCPLTRRVLSSLQNLKLEDHPILVVRFMHLLAEHQWQWSPTATRGRTVS
jgi:hypothetical protein